MFDKLHNSWQLVKASARVLQADKELIVFPIVSGIGVLLITLSFAAPMFFANIFDSIFNGQMQVLGLVMLFLFYLAQYFVIFFCNTALVGAALIRLRGGDPTVGDGFRLAFGRFAPILGYALIAATVGMILQALSRRNNSLGRFVISLIGLAWNIATYLVVPILAAEGVGPVEAIKRSVGLLKKTWGEQIIGNFGLGAFFGLINAAILITGVFAVVFTAMNFDSLALIIGLALFFLLLLLVVAVIFSTLNGIYSAAVYRYAAEGEAGEYFDPNLVVNAFIPAPMRAAGSLLDR